MLTTEEIRLILKIIADKYGFGYSDILEISKLQAKLSIMLEVSVLSSKNEG